MWQFSIHHDPSTIVPPNHVILENKKRLYQRSENMGKPKQPPSNAKALENDVFEGVVFTHNYAPEVVLFLPSRSPNSPWPTAIKGAARAKCDLQCVTEKIHHGKRHDLDDTTHQETKIVK